MKDKCYHEVDAYFPRIGKVCNFSGGNIVVMSLFGPKCPFRYSDKTRCKGYTEYIDPREKEEEST